MILIDLPAGSVKMIHRNGQPLDHVQQLLAHFQRTHRPFPNPRTAFPGQTVRNGAVHRHHAGDAIWMPVGPVRLLRPP